MDSGNLMHASICTRIVNLMSATYFLGMSKWTGQLWWDFRVAFKRHLVTWIGFWDISPCSQLLYWPSNETLQYWEYGMLSQILWWSHRPVSRWSKIPFRNIRSGSVYLQVWRWVLKILHWCPWARRTSQSPQWQAQCWWPLGCSESTSRLLPCSGTASPQNIVSIHSWI